MPAFFTYVQQSDVVIKTFWFNLIFFFFNLQKDGEKNHKVRLAVGNGVRNDVWREFLDRFGAIKICEFYGATEGNICFMNHTGKIGSVGRTNFFYKVTTYIILCKMEC